VTSPLPMFARVEEAKQEVVEIVDFLKDSRQVPENWRQDTERVLMAVPQETGKTAVGTGHRRRSTRCRFLRVRVGFRGMFVGVGRIKSARQFEQAKQHAPCHHFIDDDRRRRVYFSSFCTAVRASAGGHESASRP